MIKIEERPSKHSIGNTSLFVSFGYQQELVNAIKKCHAAIYDKKSTEWEIPISELSKFIDEAIQVQDIDLHLLEDDQQKPNKIFELTKYKTKPFDYQLEGIQYGLNHDRFLLLDMPGLGKTLQLCYLAQELMEREHLEHCLIICGINALKTNWKREIEKHTNLSCRILGQKISKKGNLSFGGIQDRLKDLNSSIEEFFVICNIESLRSDDIIKAINSGKNKFDMIICDEIHACKNPNSKQGKNFLKLKAKHLIGATGTLLLNNPVDSYVPLKWIGKERCAQSTFKYYYCIYGGSFNNEFLGYRHIDVLKEELDECSLRRTKELLNLPPKTIIHEIVDMNSDQELFYNNIKDGIIDQVDKVKIDSTMILALIARLRQATACPSILTTEPVSSTKIDRCVDLVEQIVSNNEKVIIYSTFKETLNVLSNKLVSLKPVICTGDIKDELISKRIDEFQTNPECKVMLATWSKMGTGFTLTAAKNAIFIDCAWTASANEQAEDRIHRIGSKDPVFIYYLWANNTIDMRVKELVEDKSLISDYIVDDKISPKLFSKLKQIIVDLSR